jgi:hypothetical protein
VRASPLVAPYLPEQVVVVVVVVMMLEEEKEGGTELGLLVGGAGGLLRKARTCPSIGITAKVLAVLATRASRSNQCFKGEDRNQPRETRMSDLGLQPREGWKQPGRLPAEGRLGSSENTSNCLFCFLLGPLCIRATYLAFGA